MQNKWSKTEEAQEAVRSITEEFDKRSELQGRQLVKYRPSQVSHWTGHWERKLGSETRSLIFYPTDFRGVFFFRDFSSDWRSGASYGVRPHLEKFFDAWLIRWDDEETCSHIKREGETFCVKTSKLKPYT